MLAASCPVPAERTDARWANPAAGGTGAEFCDMAWDL